MTVHERLFGTLGYVTDFPGLTKESRGASVSSVFR